MSSKGIEVDPKKKDAVKRWPRTLTPSDIRSFLDFAGYNRRFVEGFYSISHSLKSLTYQQCGSFILKTISNFIISILSSIKYK